MKKIFTLFSMACMLLLLFSCNYDSIPEDMISFTVNGTLVELTKGFTFHNSVPVLCRMTEDGTFLVLIGTDEETSGEEPNEYIIIMITGDSAGSFSGAMCIYVDYSSGIYSEGTASGTIDELNAVGEYCTGTFYGSTVGESMETYDIEDGEFNVIRAADNSIAF